MKDRKLDARLAGIDSEVDARLRRLLAPGADCAPVTLEPAELVAEGLAAIALEVRALRLAVLAREPVKWWW